uniref:DOD-type homing endonuclease domain-containing protein n=1 Tax=candidate division CPR3 bacterium TaxID=2268181 RepID=A0A7V3JAQ4_UNCC3
MPRVIIPHKYQKQVLLSKKRFVIAIAGIQAGKTLCGVLWLIQEIKKNPRGTFLVGAPSFKILNQSTLEKIFEVMPEGVWGSYNKMEQVYRLKSGGKIFFRSLESPDSVEGMTANAVWLDEAGQMKYRAWVNVLSRVSATNGRILITSSPYCYDEKTEIYTRNGWKKFGELTDDDEVFACNENGEGWFEKPQEIVWQRYKGKMFHFKGHAIDLLVTPNHRILYKNSNRFYIKTAEHFFKLKHRCLSIPKAVFPKIQEQEFFVLPPVENKCRISKPIKISMKDWLAFLGWFLSEGGIRKKGKDGQYQVYISQKEGKKWEILKSDLEKLPFKFSYNKKSGLFLCSNKQLWSYLKKLGNKYTKYIPNEFKFVGKNNLMVLIDRMILGDGSYRKNGRKGFSYYTVSKRLAEDFQEVCMLCGIPTKISERKQADSCIQGRIIKATTSMFHITERVRKRAMVKERRIVDYDGYIGCVAVSTGLILVRRNGEECISGNTVNWLYKQIYQKVKSKELGYENFEIVEWESVHNPYFPKENYEHAKMVLPLSEFERKYKGMFRRMQGLVYEDIFDDQGNFRNVVSDLPQFQKVICGVDWGYRDPTALAFLGITENGQVYLFDEVYKSGLTLPDIISILKDKVFENKISFIYAGKDQPGYIDELNLKGIPTMAANNEIFFGIGRVRALIRMGRFFIHRRCTNALEEFTLYVYKENDKMVEEPADENNHMMDAIRYAIASHPEFMQLENEGKVYSADQKTDEFWKEVKEDINRSYQRLRFGEYDDEDYWNMINEVI